MYLTGSDIKIYTGETPILFGQAKSCTIVYRTDSHESAGIANGRMRTYIAGRTGWEVVVGKLVTNMRKDLLRIGQTVSITLKVDNSDKVTGTAIVTQCQLTVQEGNLVQCSVRFLGTGALA